MNTIYVVETPTGYIYADTREEFLECIRTQLDSGHVVLLEFEPEAGLRDLIFVVDRPRRSWEDATWLHTVGYRSTLWSHDVLGLLGSDAVWTTRATVMTRRDMHRLMQEGVL